MVTKFTTVITIAWRKEYQSKVKALIAYHGEIFAISFSADGIDRMLCGAKVTLSSAKSGSWGNFWELYYSTKGIELSSNHDESRLFIIIDDLTNDIDTPKDYHRVYHRYRYASSSKSFDRLLISLWLFLLSPLHIIRKTLRLGEKPRKLPKEYYRSHTMQNLNMSIK